MHNMVKDIQDALIASVTIAIKSEFKTLEERLTSEMKKKDDRIAELEAELSKLKGKSNENTNKV